MPGDYDCKRTHTHTPLAPAAAAAGVLPNFPNANLGKNMTVDGTVDVYAYLQR